MCDARRAVVAGYADDASTAERLVDHPRPEVRTRALGALGRLGTLTDTTLSLALTDGDAGVRRRAVELALSHPAVDLRPLLDDPSDAVVEQAAWACGERGEASTVERLADLATAHDDPLVREAAVAALGAIGDERGLPAILAATRDRATVRRRAVIALAPFEGAEVDEALVRASADRDWQVRQAAEDLSSRA